MSDHHVNHTRRRLLTATTAGVGAIGAAAMVVPFGWSLAPSERARAAGAPVEFDLSKMEDGQQLTVEWRGKPVWVLKRTPEMIADLPTLDPELVDPNSTQGQQPDYCQNPMRAREASISIMVGICTHLGCSPTFRPDLAAADISPDWKGGYFCPCHGSRFDLAGRVFKGVPAPKNLVVPPYKFLNEDNSLVLIGDDSEATS